MATNPIHKAQPAGGLRSCVAALLLVAMCANHDNALCTCNEQSRNRRIGWMRTWRRELWDSAARPPVVHQRRSPLLLLR